MHFAIGREIVILDAAVLLEAGWDSMTHEVWTTFIPKEEVIPLVRSKFATVSLKTKNKKKQTRKQGKQQCKRVLTREYSSNRP